VESKLKKVENSPTQSWRKSSIDQTANDPSKQEIEEITAFVRKSAVVGIKRLVAENALIQVHFVFHQSFTFYSLYVTCQTSSQRNCQMRK
jgi:hypothetical protein